MLELFEDIKFEVDFAYGVGRVYFALAKPFTGSVCILPNDDCGHKTIKNILWLRYGVFTRSNIAHRQCLYVVARCVRPQNSKRILVVVYVWGHSGRASINHKGVCILPDAD